MIENALIKEESIHIFVKDHPFGWNHSDFVDLYKQIKTVYPPVTMEQLGTVCESLKENYDKFSVRVFEKEKLTHLGSLLDIGSSLYEIEWSRIANMQQNASILVGIFAVVISIVTFAFQGVWQDIVSLESETGGYPIFVSLIASNLISVMFLLINLSMVLWPGQLKVMPDPQSLDKQLMKNRIEVTLYDLIGFQSESINETSQYVENKKKWYKRTLIVALVTVLYGAFSSGIAIFNYYSILSLDQIVTAVMIILLLVFNILPFFLIKENSDGYAKVSRNTKNSRS